MLQFMKRKQDRIHQDDVDKIHERINEWFTEESKWFDNGGDVGLLIQNICTVSLVDCTLADLRKAGYMVRTSHPYSPVLRLNNLLILLEMELGSSVMNILSRNWVNSIIRLSPWLDEDDVREVLVEYPALMLLPFIMNRALDRLRRSA